MAPPQISRKTLGFLLLLAAAAVSPAAADDVVALTEADFEKEVGQDRGALVEFYAPWFAVVPVLSASRIDARFRWIGSDRVRGWVGQRIAESRSSRT